MEHWRDIEGYEGKYQISDLGRVKSLNYQNTGKERVLVGYKVTGGYICVGLRKDGKRKMCKVHRLVANAFIPNPNNLPQINHKDECKTNNTVSNLEWCDAKYNNNYGTRTERTSKIVYQYTLDVSLLKSYPSGMEAERRTGYDQGAISDCCLGKRKQAYGYIWSYSLLVPNGQLF